jgi:autotransporter-associated beta strand protein
VSIADLTAAPSVRNSNGQVIQASLTAEVLGGAQGVSFYVSGDGSFGDAQFLGSGTQGSNGWTLDDIDTTGFANTETLFAVATDPAGLMTDPAALTVGPAAIGTFQVVPGTSPSAPELTLSAGGIIDWSSPVTSVNFYQDTSGTGVFNVATATLLGTATMADASGDWNWNVDPAGSYGPQTFFAVASDSAGASGEAVSAASLPPMVTSLTPTLGDFAGTWQSITLSAAVEGETAIDGVTFYQDTSGTGIFNAATATLLGSGTLDAEGLWSATFPTASVNSSATIFAVAADASGLKSSATAVDPGPFVIGQLAAVYTPGAPSPLGPGFPDSDPTVTLAAAQFTDWTGQAQSVSFYEDPNGSTTFDATNDILLGTADASSSWALTIDAADLTGDETFFAVATDGQNLSSAPAWAFAMASQGPISVGGMQAGSAPVGNASLVKLTAFGVTGGDGNSPSVSYYEDPAGSATFNAATDVLLGTSSNENDDWQLTVSLTGLTGSETYFAVATDGLSTSDAVKTTAQTSDLLYWDPNHNGPSGLGGSGEWTDGGAADWYDPAIGADVAWDNASGETAVFSAAAGTVAIDSGISAGEVDFATSGYTLTGGSLAISGSGTIDVGAGLSDTIDSALNGTDGLTKTSDGTLVLAGANTHSGATNIVAGRLTLQDVTLASDSIDVSSGATLEYDITTGSVVQASTTLSGSGTLQKTGDGTLTLGGLGIVNWDFGSGALIDVEGGTLVGGSYIQDVWTNDLASLNIASGATFNGVEANVQVDALTGAGTLAGGYPGAGYTADTIGVNNGSGTFSGTIQDAYEPLNLVKAGSGTETLAGADVYSGSTSVTGGQLTLENITLASGSIAVSASATLEYNITTGNIVQASTTLSGAGTLEKTGDGTLLFGGLGIVNWDFGSGALIDVEGGTLVGGSYIQDVWTSDLASLNIASGATFNGVEANVEVDALTGAGTFAGGYPGAGYTADTIGVNNGSGTFSGTIQDAYEPLNLVKAGSGTETLTGASTYTGSTTVSAGTLQLGDGSSNNGSVAGDIIDNAAIVFDNPNSQTYSGSISGNGTVTKNGAGTLIFNGPNDYMGDTIINAGTLEVDIYIMPSAVTVNAGGTLQGSGGTGAVTNNGGTYVANYYYVQLLDTTLQRGDTAATDIGSASISVGPTDAIYAMSAAQAVFQVISGSATTTDTGDTYPISTAAIAGADGHPAFIYSADGYHNDNNGAFQNIGPAIMFEDYTGHPGCDYDYNDGYFRVSVTLAHS